MDEELRLQPGAQEAEDLWEMGEGCSDGCRGGVTLTGQKEQ